MVAFKKLLGRVWEGLPFKRPLLEPVRRLGVLPERIYRHLHFRGVFRTRVLDAELILRSHGYQIENQVFWSGVFGDFEGSSLRLWTSLAATADVVLDVGANTGIYALTAQAVNPTSTVFAFEPVPPILRILEENADLNGGKVRCVGAAVTDRSGTATIFVPKGSHAYASSLDPSVFGAGVGQDWGSLEVDGVRLDDFLSELQLTPKLLKVDVEGHELSVLRGLGAMLAAHRPTLLLEILTQDRAEEIWTLLGGLGYQAFEIDEAIGPQHLHPGRAPSSGRNVLYCTEEIAVWLNLLPDGSSSA